MMRRAIVLAATVIVALACGAQPAAVSSASPTRAATPTTLDTQIPTPSPSPSRTPLVVLTPALPPICAGRAVPTTGTVLDPCRTVAGVASAVTPTGFTLQPDYGQEQALGLVDLAHNSGRIRVDLGPGVVAPKVGAHVSAIGPLVSLADGAHALTPAYRLDLLAEQPPSVPEGVLEARVVWAAARSAWPLIPPVIIAEGDVNGTAAAALYSDGIARLLVHTGEVPDAHTIWHEAGHVYHAAVLRSHGHSSALFTSEDEVGTAYWTARGLPGTWAQSLATGAWATTGYEILAETFAAVNLGDTERASTSDIPLDRTKMRAFFAGLSG
jgi:hypothetical protein